MSSPIVIAAPDHPALGPALARFAEELRAETRYFGRRGRAARKPTPSFVRRLVAPAPGVRLAALVDGRVVGVARADATGPDGPELRIAVVAEWRGRGVARTLTAQILERTGALGYQRLVVRSSRRSTALRALAASLGCELVDHGRGRIDVILRWEALQRAG